MDHGLDKITLIFTLIGDNTVIFGDGIFIIYYIYIK